MNDLDSRIKEIDYMKAICALSVIWIHATAGYVEYSDFAYMTNQISRYAVPMFILLSGFGLFLSEKKKRNAPILSFYKKRVDKILIPYILWSLIYFVFANRHQLLATEWTVQAAKLAKQLFMGTAFVHLYFLIIMIQLYVLFPLLKKWMEEKPNAVLVASFLVTLGFHVGLYAHATQIFLLPSLGVPYVILFPVWMFYFAMGMYMAKKADRVFGIIQHAALGKTFWLWLLALVVLVMDSKMTNTFASSTKPSTLFYTAISFVFLYKCAGFIQNSTRAEAFFSWFSTHSFFIYLLHPLIISVLAQYFPSTFTEEFGVYLMLAIAICISLVVTYLCSYVKYIRFWGGVYAPAVRSRSTVPEHSVGK